MAALGTITEVHAFSLSSTRSESHKLDSLILLVVFASLPTLPSTFGVRVAQRSKQQWRATQGT
jgi:hypothetical protein